MCSSSMQIPDAHRILMVIRASDPPAMSANATNTTQNAVPYDSPPVTIILTITLLVFFLAGFFSVYFCRCFMDSINNSWNLGRNPSGNNPNPPQNASALPGLDPEIIESFPTFVYSDVKDIRKGKSYDLECAICLCEFVDDDSLRLLTFCCHVFHQDCIDLWLKSHKTCPVCRKTLDATPSSSPLKCPLLRTTSRPPPNDANEVGSVSITIREDDEIDGDTLGALDRFKNVAQDGSSSSSSEEPEEKFSRSHSTGHSIVKNRENRIDRYTLRLPDDFHPKGHHNCTKSCTAIGEYSNSRHTASAKKECAAGFVEVVSDSRGGGGGSGIVSTTNETSIQIDGHFDNVSLVSDCNDKYPNLRDTTSTTDIKDGKLGEAYVVCDGNDSSSHSRNSSATSRNSVVVRFSDVDDKRV